MTNSAAFLAGMVAMVIFGALAYYGAEAFNSYVDARARQVILDTLQGLDIKKYIEPPSKQDS